jgi:hypothetical protein
MHEPQYVTLRGMFNPLMQIVRIRLRDNEPTEVLCQWGGGNSMWCKVNELIKFSPLTEADLEMWIPG